MSAQQVALYVIKGQDNYTNHTFCSFYWKSIETFIEKSLPLQPIDFPHENHIQNPTVIIDPDESLEETHVGISSTKGLIMKSSQLEDYIYRPNELNCLSLWDFIAHCEKIYQPKKHFQHQDDDSNLTDDESTDIEDDIDLEPFENENENGSYLHPAHDILTYEAISIYSKSHKILNFLPNHKEASSHGIHVYDYLNSSIPVLTGPSIPRRDNPDCYERYCCLMLMFFAPWRSPHDLSHHSNSWSFAYESFLISDNVKKHDIEIMDNIQMLHECKENRDKDYHKCHKKNETLIQTDHPSMPIPTYDDLGNPLSIDTNPEYLDNDLEQMNNIASKLQHNSIESTDLFIKKGIVNGLFSMSYQNTLDISNVKPQSPSVLDYENIWSIEYENRKTSWKNDQIEHGMLASSVYEHSSNSITGIHSLPLQSSSSNPTQINALTPSDELLFTKSQIQMIIDLWTLDPDQQ